MPLDRVFVDQQQEDPAAGFRRGDRGDSEKEYRVTDSEGQCLYRALEESGVCARCCLGHRRAWDFHVLEPGGQEVVRVARRLRCGTCCFPCCLQQVTVHSGSGELLGSVTQNWNAWRPSFTIRDSADAPVLLMKGPVCTCDCAASAGKVDFLIKSIDKRHRVGVITKKWSALAREFFRDDGDSFAVCFPADLDVKIKAVLIGACFLVDFMYFENQSRRQHHSKTA